jgi:AcrR family transcriptional regulator
MRVLGFFAMPAADIPHTGRSTKGERTRRAILDGAREIVGEVGTGGLSQEAAAKRAGISQSALRHYFLTKDALLAALFDDVLQDHRARFAQIVLEPGATDAGRLARMVHTHLDSIVSFDDSTMLEVFAFWARNQQAGAARRAFHGWLIGHYADSIQALRPELSAEECREVALQVLTLTLGAWLTLGRSRPHLLDRSAARVKKTLLRAVDAIVGVPLPW